METDGLNKYCFCRKAVCILIMQSAKTKPDNLHSLYVDHRDWERDFTE